jgi:signal transduction histidine kinase
MRPMNDLPPGRASGEGATVPTGPATTMLRSVIARFASVVRCAGIAYVLAQVVVWHAFYAADSVRLAGPVAATIWAAAVTIYLRRGGPGPLFACIDSAVYVALALTAQACVPPATRDDAFSWLVISMSSQLVVPAWYASARLATPLALAAPVAYWVGAERMAGAGSSTMALAAILLIGVGVVHSYGRWALYRRAAAADAALDEADRDASEQFVNLSRNIERREHERLLHDTVLNTLTALAHADSDDMAEVRNWCRQDVARIAAALSDPADQETGTGRPDGDLSGAVRAVAAEMRSRGLNVHVDIADDFTLSVPPQVATAISNAMREALSNVAAHAGTAEAFVEVSRIGLAEHPEGSDRLQVSVRDFGTGFDLARVDQARLGLRRSIAERIEDCGGKASIWSAPGEGTLICMSWPAPAQVAAAVAQLAPAQPAPTHVAAAVARRRALERPPW